MTAIVSLGRDICSDLTQAERREWLVTNGIGGFASGTIAGTLTRRYHGLLIAALKPPVGRTLLVSKFDEIVAYNGRSYSLHVNHWTGGALEPGGYLNIQNFCLEGTTPVWTFALADALLEKRIWMQQGANTTYIQYRLLRATAPLTLTIKALVNYRDFHSETSANDWQMSIDPVPNGLKVIAYDGAIPFYLLCHQTEAVPQHNWYRRYFMKVEANRGLNATEDHLLAGEFQYVVEPSTTLAIVVSIDATPNLDGDAAYAERRLYEADLLRLAEEERQKSKGQRGKSEEGQPSTLAHHPSPLDQLILAADQFLVKRPFPKDPNGRSLIAGYHWFSDSGRDTMIALSGLTLVTGRSEIAAKILRTFAHFVDQGMLPNQFPDVGQTPEYNTVDTTLWYFEAFRAYYASTGDLSLVQQLYSVFQDIVGWHQRGTRYNVHMDPADGLLYAGEPGVQLTWMDAKVGDWVVTPRQGKPVEINALWYNALSIMVEFAGLLGNETAVATYSQMAQKTVEGFGRFWNHQRNYCYDVLDTSTGDDPTLRPNQILAASLPYSPLTPEQQKAVVDVCGSHLLTSYGLRSLAIDDPAYIGSYGGNPHQRDASYHQGTAWGWLLGPFVQAHYRVYKNAALSRSYLTPLFDHLSDAGLGSISEIFDGDPPHTPRGCIAQAWSVAEILRAWQVIC